jgi:hypothetical protein
VENLINLRIRKFGNPKKYNGKIIDVAYQIDLALITVIEEEFWKAEDISEIVFSKNIPNLQEKVYKFLNQGYLCRISNRRNKFINNNGCS